MLQKITNYVTFRLQNLFLSESPEFDRKWAWVLDTEFEDFSFCVFLAQELRQFEGKPRKHPVRGIYVTLYFPVEKWKLEQFHTYYDGNHCSYWLGPLQIYLYDMYNCKKCWDR